MKTSLRYNTIETLQNQPEWRKFLTLLVDKCNTLFDDNIVATINETSQGKSVNQIKLGDKSIVENYESLSDDLKTKYARVNDVYGNIDIPYEDLHSRHAIMGLINDLMSLNLRENISLRGLLRTLSLYKCRIKNISVNESGLPHTFKVEGAKKEENAIYGYDTLNMSYDHEARGEKPQGASGSYPQDYLNGDVGCEFIDYVNKNYEDEDTTFKYIYNIYGYNQKNPIISTCKINEVFDFQRFTLKDGISVTDNIPQYLYVKKGDIILDLPNNSFILKTEFVYWSNDDDNSGIFTCDDTKLNLTIDDEKLSKSAVIARNYSFLDNGVPVEVRKWIYDSDETAYLFNENDKVDLFKSERIKYNDEDVALDKYSNVRFVLNENSNIEKIREFKKVGEVGSKTEYVQNENIEVQKKYFVYRDNIYDKNWIVRDTINDYFKMTPAYQKSLLYVDECTLKSQPLFVYDVTENDERNTCVSLCANLFDTDMEGGLGKISYELDLYDKNKIYNGLEHKNNQDSVIELKGVFYGDWYNKWEQYNNDTTHFYKKDVYTMLDFANMDGDESLEKFYDGDKSVFHIERGSNEESATDEEIESYNNFLNKEHKVLGDYSYDNTYKQEYFETMYFNHFIKVYPIVDEETDSPVKTMKLYCDNLELVMFGNMVPFVVSYDRIGEQPEQGSAEILNDIDCSIFSKILTYNKHTHLITVNYPVLFENSHTPKYVVVAYQNVSPFNRIKSLDIIAPNIYDYKKNNVEGYYSDGVFYSDEELLNPIQPSTKELYKDITDSDNPVFYKYDETGYVELTKEELTDDIVYNNVDEDNTFALKGIIDGLLADYENSNCSLKLYSECEYKGSSML